MRKNKRKLHKTDPADENTLTAFGLSLVLVVAALVIIAILIHCLK
jgi:hypothetical protein